MNRLFFGLDIIDKINSFIDGLNKIQIPDWVPGLGGKGFNIPHIPKLRVGMDFVPEDIYQWYGSPSVQSEIQKLARKSYLNGENNAVMEQIDRMSADEAKQLLKKLVTEDVEVGISIISKEGE